MGSAGRHCLRVQGAVVRGQDEIEAAFSAP